MYKQVKEILETVKSFHHDLAGYYLSLKEKSGDQRTIMMLDYLSRREEYIAEYLEKYLECSKDTVLKSWVKFVPWLPTDVFCHCKEELQLVAPLYVDDILDVAMHYDHCLVEFFTILVQESDERSTVAIFENLLNSAHKEEMKLAKSTLWLNDI